MNAKARKAWRCTHHPDVLIEEVGPCARCVQDLASARDASQMTGQEREDELRKWVDGRLSVEFSALHKRAEELVGRPVWTHEFARPEGLYREARSWKHPENLNEHAIQSLQEIAGDKPVIALRPDTSHKDN